MINNYVSPDEKIYFQPGDICQMKQDIPNKPKMVVVRIERSIIKRNEGKDYLKGVRCRWFSTDQKLQEGVFSTKDLILIKND